MDSSFSAKNDSKVSVNVFSSFVSSLSVSSASSEEAFVLCDRICTGEGKMCLVMMMISLGVLLLMIITLLCEVTFTVAVKNSLSKIPVALDEMVLTIIVVVYAVF